MRMLCVLLLVAASLGVAHAGGPTAVIISPKAGDKIEFPSDYRVKFGVVKGAIAYNCKLIVDDSGDGAGCDGGLAHPSCQIREIESGNTKVGPATISCAAQGKDGWGSDVTVAVQLVARPVVGYTGPKFNGHYWRNISGGQGQTQLDAKELSIKNGVVRIPISIGPFEMGTVTAKIEADGRILPQPSPVTKGKAKPGVAIADYEQHEADSVKHVTLSGTWEVREGEGKTVDIKIATDQKSPQGEAPFFSGRMVIDGAQGAKVTWCSRDIDCESRHNCCPNYGQ